MQLLNLQQVSDFKFFPLVRYLVVLASKNCSSLLNRTSAASLSVSTSTDCLQSSILLQLMGGGSIHQGGTIFTGEYCPGGLSRKIWSGGKKWSGRTNFGRPKLVRPCQNWSYMRTNEAPPSYCSCIAIQAAMDSSDVGDLTAEVYQYLTEGR